MLTIQWSTITSIRKEQTNQGTFVRDKHNLIILTAAATFT
jgi:hypothetical protein